MKKFNIIFYFLLILTFFSCNKIKKQNPAEVNFNSIKETAYTKAEDIKYNFGIAGFCTLNGGTTGGKGGTVVEVSTLVELAFFANANGKYIIKITAPITGSSEVKISDDKTIVGIGTSGVLTGIGFNLTGAKNIILRNLKMSMVQSVNKGDILHLQDGTYNVWIDHMELFNESPLLQNDVNKYDGLIDITGDCAYITISWCYFHDHWKAILVGATDEDNYDRMVTFHHNKFFNIAERQPGYGFGTAHIFNNYYYKTGAGPKGAYKYCINSKNGAQIRIEYNYFEDSFDTIVWKFSEGKGYWDLNKNSNVYDNCKGWQPTLSTCAFNPPYEYLAVFTRVEYIPAIVNAYSGVGKLNTPWTF